MKKLAIIKKQMYLIRAHYVGHVNNVMQRMSRDRLLQSMMADSLLQWFQTVRRDAPVRRFNFPKASRDILVLCH